MFARDNCMNLSIHPISTPPSPPLVCYTAVFSVVTQRSSLLRDDSKNGCVADYPSIDKGKDQRERA